MSAVTDLEFINTDQIAVLHWSGDTRVRGYDATAKAAAVWDRYLA